MILTLSRYGMEYSKEFNDAFDKFQKAQHEALNVRIPILSVYVMTEYNSFGKSGCEFVYNFYFTSMEKLIDELKGWPNSVVAILNESLCADNVTRYNLHGKKLKNKFTYHQGGGLLRLNCYSNKVRDNFIPVSEICCAEDSKPGFARAIESFYKPKNWGDDDTSEFGLNIIFSKYDHS